jgi:hypothetical protein
VLLPTCCAAAAAAAAGCKHSFCKGCLAAYLKTHLQDKQLPACTASVTAGATMLTIHIACCVTSITPCDSPTAVLLLLLPNCQPAGCRHSFCKPCLAAYLKARLQDKQLPAACPSAGCKRAVSQGDAALLLAGNPRLRNKFIEVSAHCMRYISSLLVLNVFVSRCLHMLPRPMVFQVLLKTAPAGSPQLHSKFIDVSAYCSGF